MGEPISELKRRLQDLVTNEPLVGTASTGVGGLTGTFLLATDKPAAAAAAIGVSVAINIAVRIHSGDRFENLIQRAGGRNTGQMTAAERSLQAMYIEELKDCLTSARSGEVIVNTLPRVANGWQAMCPEARKRVQALDGISMRRWIRDPNMLQWLELQTTLVNRSVPVTRIRPVDEKHLNSEAGRRILREYVQLQDRAGIRLHLCSRGQYLSTKPTSGEVGFMVADGESGREAFATLTTLNHGNVTKGRLYPRGGDPVSRLVDRFTSLEEHFVRNGWDAEFRHRWLCA